MIVAMKKKFVWTRESISISEFRKNPNDYFTGHAIAVTSNNRKIGYAIGADTYEQMLSALSQPEQTSFFEGKFRPSAERLQQIARDGAKALEGLTKDDSHKYSE